ncbi:MAG: hypothetical protein EOP85_09670, partial [Verrucomicrobiaceae bacterium]
MKPLLFLTSCLLLALPAAMGQSVSTPTGLWEFGNGSALGQATVGTNLTVTGAAPAHSATLSDGTTTLHGAITTVGGTANRLVMPNTAGATGGGTLTNEYTLLFDVFSPAASRASWRCLLQTNAANSNDGDYFIRNTDDRIGVSGLGYSANPLPETVWTRLVLVFDINAAGTASTVKAYTNGTLFHTHNITGGRDGTYGLGSTALLFADNDGENAALNIGAVGFWGKTLTIEEITALGGPGTPVIANPENQPPVIAQGASTAMPGAKLNGPSVSTTLTASDAENQPLSWTITTPATSGTASITSQSSAGAVVGYTPAPGFTGVDSFVVRVSDGEDSDDITVNVVVSDPAVTTKVFYQENFNTAALLPEVTTGDQRRMPADDNTPVWNMPEDSGLGLASGANLFRNPVND